MVGAEPAGAPAAPDPTVLADGADCGLEEPPQGVTCTVLYAHIFDLLNRVPINTQLLPECASDLAKGFTTVPTVEPVYDFNQLTLYQTPSLVEYDDSCTEPRMHPLRGLTYEVDIADEIVPMRAFFYLSADADEYSMIEFDPDVDAGAMPCVTVRMRLYTGAHSGEGPLLAEGTTTRTLLTGGSLSGTHLPLEEPCPGSAGPLAFEEVTEFEVDLSRAQGNLSALHGWVLQVEWWQHAVNDDQKVAQREWNVHTGHDHRPRLVVPVWEPLRVESFRVFQWEGRNVATVAVQSPWGSYDVDVGSLRLEILDIRGKPLSVELPEPRLLYSVDHGGLLKPVNATWVWPVGSEGLPPGPYVLRFSATNLQQTSTVTAERDFWVRSLPQEAQALSGAPLALLVLAAALVAGRMRPPLPRTT